ncbi:hypothetical protein [Sphingomonas sp.]|uniref:hypothetical protein n=1 Tax=Sphingomonas sp. TaxID=28214 RepID=UPI0035C7FBA2
MSFKSMLGGGVAAALLTVSTAAAAAPAPANPAASLSVRAATPTAKASKIGAEVPRSTLINIGILAVIIVGVLVAVGGDDDSADSN